MIAVEVVKTQEIAILIPLIFAFHLPNVKFGLSSTITNRPGDVQQVDVRKKANAVRKNARVATLTKGGRWGTQDNNYQQTYEEMLNFSLRTFAAALLPCRGLIHTSNV